MLDFADEYDLLPVTDSASADDGRPTPKHAELSEFLDGAAHSQLYPVGKTSWAAVSETIKQKIGEAVEPGGEPGSGCSGR